MEWKSEFFNNRKEEDSDEIEAYGCICSLLFFFFVKNMQKDVRGRGKSERCRENKRRGEKTVPFLLGHVCTDMRAFYQQRMHRGQHMCFLSLDGFSSTLAVPRLLCAYLFKPFLRVLPRSEN